MKLIAALAAAFALAQQAALPPPYPRAGTTSLIDNGRVLVWDVTLAEGERDAVFELK